MDRIIRHTRDEDIAEVMVIFAHARETMRQDGNMHQWVGGYPSEESIRQDIARGVSYVIEQDGVLTGTFAFIPGIEPTYGYIEGGSWLDDTLPYATVHRIAARHGSHGTAALCFEWCSARVPNLRIDTHRDNRIMQHCIARAGFTYCGIIYLANGDERLAYQKIFTDSIANPKD